MRKIKKSAKIIISLACVLAVAIVGIVTAVLIVNSKKGKGKNPPNIPAIVLFGETSGMNFLLPNALPNKYAKVSVIIEQAKVNINPI